MKNLSTKTPSLTAVSDAKTTKEKLFDAAVDLFSTQGFSGVSIRDITHAVGIKESSFYNHYKSKDELIASIFDKLKTEFSGILPPEEHLETNLAQLTPQEFLARGNQLFLERMVTPRLMKIWRTLFIEQHRDPRARDLIQQELVQRPLAYTETVFRKMIEMELIKPLDPKIMAAEYFYPVAFLTSYLMSDSDDAQTNNILQQMQAHLIFFWNLVKK